jgi:hypothetical protein
MEKQNDNYTRGQQKSSNCISNSCKFVKNVEQSIIEMKYFSNNLECQTITQNILLQVYKKSKHKEIEKKFENSIKFCSSCNC